ncbi:hypothetical protein [Subtercola sp. YIM 133946]|uniref:hypothetical protein n=1 Tax=Subtercola sp. YIM 133946 TaxID=3118909 RepID=UPI002F935607
MNKCMVDRCGSAAAEEIEVREAGLQLIYAVCAEHLSEMDEGAVLMLSADPHRGLVGLASS